MKKVLIFTLLLPLLLYAFHKEDVSQKTDAQENSLFDRSLDTIETQLKKVYNGLNLSSKYIDEFLTNQQDNTIYTNSYIRLESTYFAQTNVQSTFQSNVDIKIHLPKLKEKLSFEINNQENKVNQKFNDSEEEVKYKNNSYNAGLLYQILKDQMDLSFKLGVKLSTHPDIFAQATAKKSYALNFNNLIELEENLKYSSKKELENTTTLRYTYKINNKLNFSNLNEYYTNTKEYSDYFHNSLRLNHTLSKKSHINYVAHMETNNNDTHLKVKEYGTYVSYRKYIRNWLYYDIVPNVMFEETNNFKDEYGIKVRLGFLIGK